MILDPELAMVLLNVPSADKVKFSRPMSKRARKLLNDMVKWGITYIKKNPVKLGKLIAGSFEPIRYEEAAHVFDTTGYTKVLDIKKIKTDEEFIYFFTLQNLTDQKWLRANGLPPNDKRIGIISDPASASLYDWFVEHFLLADFMDQDLNKITYLSNGQFDIEIIKSEARKITDPDKRNIAYLYAIVRDVSIRAASLLEKEKTVDDESQIKLALMMQEHFDTKVKNVFTIDDDNWSRDREYIDLLRSDKDQYDK